jgi:hypothetical protein
MILQINNIAISKEAAVVLRKARSAFRPRHTGDVFAMYFVSSFVNADGTAVEGFHPGYEAGRLSLGGLKAQWAKAHLPEGLDFYFMPKFTWRA